MVKSELYSNLKQAIDMLVELLIPEGSKELSYWGSEEDELNLLQEEISALDYSCLDEIVKKYSLGEVTGNQCVLNKMYDDMFAQKGSYAFYIQWLNNEFPSEVEYQKKLQETKGLKKILVMATKPNHLATIE